LIAKEMTMLSMEDRERVYYDLHGVSDEIKETPEMIKQGLSELEKALLELAHKDAYDLAEAMNPEYVQRKEFRLKFLRAEYFVAKNAALRLARFFQAKLDLFGRYKLAQDIVQDDLDEDDMAVLYGGGNQSLPIRDRAGRAVAVWFPSQKTQSMDCKAKVRMYYYRYAVCFCLDCQCHLIIALEEHVLHPIYYDSMISIVAIYCFLISF
jgi:hypothetical protein